MSADRYQATKDLFLAGQFCVYLLFCVCVCVCLCVCVPQVSVCVCVLFWLDSAGSTACHSACVIFCKDIIIILFEK